MCTTSLSVKKAISLLEADDRDALRDFARQRRDRAKLPRHREFWQSLVEACQHPRGVLLAGDFDTPRFEGYVSFIPNREDRPK